MPAYPYRCDQGHETDVFFHMADTKPPVVACESCGQPAKRAVVLPRVQGDIPEHFNETLGMAVRGRTHLKQIQREQGCQDYEPGPSMREKLKESREKTLHAAGRGKHSVGG
jgi:putative FmdB family regulatory protein